MQSKVDIPGKQPPKAFVLPVAHILLTFIIGLIFITLASATPHLQNSTGPVKIENVTSRLDGFQEELNVLVQNIQVMKGHVNQLSGVAANISRMLTSCVGNMDAKTELTEMKRMVENIEARLDKPGVCLPNWRKHGNKCFLFINLKMNWYSAENHCLSKGGHLASVPDSDMYYFLRHLAGTNWIWVGGYKADENGEWRWTDGSKFEVKKYEDKSANDAAWGPHEPNNYFNEKCVEALSQRGLNDLTCTKERLFICQK